jgi:glycosyltransferase involved in cell wall biosynthesis
MPNSGDGPLRVIHVIARLSAEGYGVWEVAWAFARHGRRSCETAIAGIETDSTDSDIRQGEYAEGVRVIRARGGWPASLGRSPDLRRRIEHFEPHIVHAHGMWLLTGRSARRAAQHVGAKLIISPHGMLERWARSSRGWKKTLAWHGWERANLAAADALHTTAAMEARTLRERGLGHPIAIVPNGVHLGDYSDRPEPETVARLLPEVGSAPFVLCVGRINPIKGVMHLARAWGMLHQRFQSWKLVIAGPDQDGHRREVEAELERLGVRGSVIFPGVVRGELKRALLATAGLYVQPSEQENFGITIAESLASAVPVVTTVGTPWTELEEHDCGRRVAVDGAALAEAAGELLGRSGADRRAMGERGRALVERRYTWPAVAESMATAYRWLAGGATPADRPSCVLDERSA